MAYRGEFGESFNLDASSCKYPGCTRARYREPYGFVHEFCGKTHATAYSRLVNDKKSSGYHSSSIMNFKPKRGDTRLTQGRVTPVVGDHKVDHGYAPKSSSMLSSSAKPWHSSDIKFYHRHEPHYEFTNFSQYPIQLDGKQWPTTEHYFQAQKFIGTPYEEAIRKQPSARGAFDMSRNPSVSHWRRGDWDQVKDDVMLKCLRAKFIQHKDLREKLLGTGERNLIEHTSNDSYWGDGGDGSGQNKLGKLLMRVRKEISKHVHEHQSKFKSSLDYESLGRKDRENKHRRHSSISGITPSVSAVSSSIGSQSTLMSSKRKYRSTENLHHAAYSVKKDTPSSSYTLGRTKYDVLLASDRNSCTKHKATIKRSGSLGDLQQISNSHHRSKDTFGKCTPRANQSSVKYNIISHQY